MSRIFVDVEFRGEAEAVLDEAGVGYDYDGGDRFMVMDEDLDTAIEVLEDAGIDCEEV